MCNFASSMASWVSDREGTRRIHCASCLEVFANLAIILYNVWSTAFILSIQQLCNLSHHIFSVYRIFDMTLHINEDDKQMTFTYGVSHFGWFFGGAMNWGRIRSLAICLKIYHWRLDGPSRTIDQLGVSTNWLEAVLGEVRIENAFGELNEKTNKSTGHFRCSILSGGEGAGVGSGEITAVTSH